MQFSYAGKEPLPLLNRCWTAHLRVPHNGRQTVRSSPGCTIALAMVRQRSRPWMPIRHRVHLSMPNTTGWLQQFAKSWAMKNAVNTTWIAHSCWKNLRSSSSSLILKPLQVHRAFFTILLAILVSSCQRRTLPDSRKPDHFDGREIIAKEMIDCLKHSLHPPNFSGKAQLEYASSREETGSAQIVMQSLRDSACQIALKKAGVELGRIMLTNDRYHLINRIDKNYTHGELAGLGWLPQPVYPKLQMVQDLLINGYFLPDGLDLSASESGKHYELAGQNDSLRTRIICDKKNLMPVAFYFETQEYTLETTISQYRQNNAVWSPENILAHIRQNDTGEIREAQWTWERFDRIALPKFNFLIPAHYTRQE
jgi:hypothetical protein